jgi:hypothetical protein
MPCISHTTVTTLTGNSTIYKVDPDEDYEDVAGQSRYGNIQLELETKLQNIMQQMKTLPGEFKWPPKATPKSQGSPPAIHNGIKLVE